MATLQIKNSGVAYTGPADDLEVLRAQFAQQHFVKFDGLLEPKLLTSLQTRVDDGEFYERVHDQIGPNRELCMRDNAASAALMFLVNDKKLFQVIQDVTGCDAIGCFQGRVYRVEPDREHHDSWHDDVGEDRLLGMSINLSSQDYAGGVLQLRERSSGEIVAEAPNAGRGDAVVFRLSNRFQHRITNVEGAVAKTAFAGWFRAQPDFLSMLRSETLFGREVKALRSPSLATSGVLSAPVKV